MRFLLLLALVFLLGCAGGGPQPDVLARASSLADGTRDAAFLQRFDRLYARAANCSADELAALPLPAGANRSFISGQIQAINACGQRLEKSVRPLGTDSALVTYSFSYRNPSCGAPYEALRVSFNATTGALSSAWVDVSLTRGDLNRLSSLLAQAEAAGDCGLALFFFA
ncbi:MAG: hypothetical protein QXH27_00915 [Candidatus Micrarchaeia archaeon]